MAAYIIVQNRNLRRQRIFRDRTNALDTLTDRELISRYRFHRQGILDIIDIVQNDVQRPTSRSHSIPVYLQVMVTLRQLAKGNFMSETADIHGISKSSVSRCVEDVSTSLCRNLNNIRFPDTLQQTKQDFYNLAEFPNVIGAIDCTLVPIVAPAEDEPAYICRKGYHAINVQAVADTDLRFTNMVCKWPGSVHDSFIFSQSALYEKLEQNHTGWLLGDSGYALKKYLMTPKLHPSNEQETRYNKAHSKTRVTVEKAFGVLKSRFRCLHKSGGCLLFTPAKCTKIISTAFRLHNKCINDNIPIMDDNLIENVNENNDVEQNENDDVPNAAFAIRQRLIERF